MSNIVYIYKITNNINGKCYIGQTSKTIEERWKEHINNSKRKNRKKNYLQNAILKYGKENFSIEEIEKCDISKLDEKEIYWIKFYDSFHNAYNCTLGGDGGKILELDEDKVIAKYQELKNLKKTGAYFECSPHTIADIIKKHNIKFFEWKEIDKENVNEIYLYDLCGNLLQIFQGRGEVGQWLIDNNLTTQINPYNAGDVIRHRFRRYKEFEAFGYIWKIERNYNIEKYKENKNQKAKIYYYKASKSNKCFICGKSILNDSILCNDCENAKRKQQAKEQRQEQYGITRETLKQEIRTTSFVKLSEKYEVSDNAIRKWCKSYNLPSKSSEIKKYSDEEWEKI